MKKSPELKRIEKALKRARNKEDNSIDMRDYIQYHLDLYSLGKLDRIKGPMRGGRSNDQSWWQLNIIYRDGDTHHFDDKYIEVYLGYKNKGGYWNRRQIRVAIEKRAAEVRDAQVVEKVWKRAQLAIEAPKTEDGAFAL